MRQLLEEALSLLKNFDTSTNDEFEETLRRREVILERFHALDRLMKCQQGDMSAKEWALLEDFRRSREDLIKKILETDSLVVALARDQLSVIKGDLATLVKGKNALHAYEGASLVRSRTLSDSA
ncbi:hypothetical protein [Geobacter hydrogenophilus]|uniref:hypothetical protein n=1 Tax=Geobacter hydrogenophilus TaxID=40983 RepID=UPI001BDA9A7B|nr:hypothetical protein [Geobacter hydrogenophilus]